MIVNLHKFLIYGSKAEVDRFFELAQRAGFLEFIGLSHKRSLELTDEIKSILQGIKLAKKHEIHPKRFTPPPGGPVAIARKLIELNQHLEQDLEERRLLKVEIARIAPFGDFSKEEISNIEKQAKRVVQFFCRKTDLEEKVPVPPDVIYLNTEYDLDYFMAIHKEQVEIPKMIEIAIERPVGELNQALLEVEEKIAVLEKEIRYYSNALPLLQSGLLEVLNDFHLELAKHDAASVLDNAMFAIEAWVPETRLKSLEALLNALDVFAEEIAIEPMDRVPTCMENRGAGKIGEDLVHIYDVPAPTDKDPSTWILVSFSIFFAMIVSDAGYGLLYLTIALFCKWKFPAAKGAARRFIKLAIILSSCCIAWGVLSASFFGIEIGPNNPYRRLSFMHALATKKAEYHLQHKDAEYQEYAQEYPAVKTATDGHDFFVKASQVRDGKTTYPAMQSFYDSIFMEIALLVGIIHLSLSFLRYLFRNWSGLGWVLFMIGGYLYFPTYLGSVTIANFTGLISPQTAAAWGIWIIWSGMGFAFAAALIQKKWGAFHEIMNVVQVVGDVLSYIRIYALALAGMMVASTFNAMGEALGFGGIFVILAGHLINVNLSVMGGVVHGLRLNFLEWYHYSFEGGGRLFNPLRLKR